MIWNPEYECMDRAALHELQLRRLQMTVAWAFEHVPHYRAELERRGVRPRDIRSLDDVRRLPFTDESTLRDAFPFGMFALPLDEIVRVHSSSGVTGKPVVVGYSRGDINTWTELTARVAAAARRAARRPRADGLPLRHVHQRLGHALRHGAHRRHHHPGRRRAE